MSLRAQVAAGHPATAQAAIDVLEAGGSAIDAAVAASLAAFVAEPLLASAGGSGLLLYGSADGPVDAYDFFPPVPGLGASATNATRDFRAMTVDFGASTQVFHVGRASACVPTVFDGLARAMADHGRLGLAAVAQPAIRMARQGVRLGSSGAEVFRLLWPILSLDPAGRRQLANADIPPRADSRLRNEPYAQLLTYWSEHQALPSSWNASLLAAHGEANGGSITPADLEVAVAEHQRAQRLQLGEWEIFGPHRPGTDAVHLMIDAMGKARSEGRCQDEATLALALAQAAAQADAIKHEATVRGSTTHISVSDSRGAVAGVTLSNGEGCGYVLPEFGIQLNNFLGEEDLNPGGFFRHAPGGRLPTMMAPTIARHRGTRQLIALGSGGANRIRSAVTRVLHACMHGGVELAIAINAPRVHAEGSSVWFEREGWRDAAAVEAVLSAHFDHVHAFDQRAFFFGGVHSVSVGASADQRDGAGDSRRGGVHREIRQT